ncbi:MAG TPA: hypothetical protein VF470_09740 [Sphingomicrobium sp.]
MSAGHTPGPWAVHCSYIYAPDGAIIAQVHNPGSNASDYPLEANRDLMAAAPELLDRLHDVVIAIDALLAAPDDEGRRPHAKHFADAARAAIAKATGAA